MSKKTGSAWPRRAPFRMLGRDARGGNLVEYIIIVGAVALVGLGGFRLFGRSVNAKITQQAACVGSLGTGCQGAAGVAANGTSGPQTGTLAAAAVGAAGVTGAAVNAAQQNSPNAEVVSGTGAPSDKSSQPAKDQQLEQKANEMDAFLNSGAPKPSTPAPQNTAPTGSPDPQLQQKVNEMDQFLGTNAGQQGKTPASNAPSAGNAKPSTPAPRQNGKGPASDPQLQRQAAEMEQFLNSKQPPPPSKRN